MFLTHDQTSRTKCTLVHSVPFLNAYHVANLITEATSWHTFIQERLTRLENCHEKLISPIQLLCVFQTHDVVRPPLIRSASADEAPAKEMRNPPPAQVKRQASLPENVASCGKHAVLPPAHAQLGPIPETERGMEESIESSLSVSMLDSPTSDDVTSMTGSTSRLRGECGNGWIVGL
jgi:hypothetical protein